MYVYVIHDCDFLYHHQHHHCHLLLYVFFLLNKRESLFLLVIIVAEIYYCYYYYTLGHILFLGVQTYNGRKYERKLIVLMVVGGDSVVMA